MILVPCVDILSEGKLRETTKNSVYKGAHYCSNMYTSYARRPGYENVRRMLQQNGVFIKSSRHASLPVEYVDTGPQCGDRGRHEHCTIEEREHWYQLLRAKFRVGINLPFPTVNQTGENACSFLGFSLLCFLQSPGTFEAIYGRTGWPDLVRGGWQPLWNKLKDSRPPGSNSGGGMNDIGQMLDTLQYVTTCNFENLVYVPVKDISEKYYNSAIVPRGTRYPGQLAGIQRYIESILYNHQFLIMNTDQHTRVYFSVNATHLLAIDNYPVGEKQIRRWKPNGTVLDETKGGISLVDKFFVYNNVRDLAYFAN